MPETQDFKNKTLSVQFKVALVPVESGWARAVENDVNNLHSQLLATGRAEAWGLASWPQTPITNPTPFVDRRGRISVNAELLDDGGKVLGSQDFSFDWNLTASFNNNGLSFSINEDNLSSQSVVFNAINIDDITDTLQIRIVKINGKDAEKAAAQGGIQYSTDYQKWKRIERGQQRRTAQKRARESAAATGKFFVNYMIPNYFGLGPRLVSEPTYRNSIMVLSIYNRVFLGNWFYADYGCDFGSIAGFLEEIYPNGHIGFGIYEEVKYFLGFGGGSIFHMFSGTVNTTTPALEIVLGFGYKFVAFSYSIRFAEVNHHKLQLGFRIIPELK